MAKVEDSTIGELDSKHYAYGCNKHGKIPCEGDDGNFSVNVEDLASVYTLHTSVYADHEDADDDGVFSVTLTKHDSGKRLNLDCNSPSDVQVLKVLVDSDGYTDGIELCCHILVFTYNDSRLGDAYRFKFDDVVLLDEKDGETRLREVGRPSEFKDDCVYEINILGGFAVWAEFGKTEVPATLTMDEVGEDNVSGEDNVTEEES